MTSIKKNLTYVRAEADSLALEFRLHSKEIHELAIFLFENSEVKLAKELNQLIRVVGSDGSGKIIHSFVEDNLNLTESF